MLELGSLKLKEQLTTKLKIGRMGSVGNNAPASQSIETNNATFLYVDQGQKAAAVTITENSATGIGAEISVGLAGVGAENAYVLPWEVGKAARTKLGQAHTAFFTPQLNGCGVMISGSLTEPVVVHANTQADIVYQGAVVGPGEMDWIKGYKLPIWSDLYRVLAMKLTAKALIPKENLRLFLPDEYLLEGPGGVAVFGIREGSQWAFYAAHMTTSGKSKTKKIWPA
jgi:hypothetical protein